MFNIEEEFTEIEDLTSYISSLRIKLWKEGKIRIDNYTYSEWQRNIHGEN
jgi:hypothetical protein